MSDGLYREDYKYLRYLVKTKKCVDPKRIEFKRFKALNLLSSLPTIDPDGHTYYCYRANENAKLKLKERSRDIFFKILISVIAGLLVWFITSIIIPLLLRSKPQETQPSPSVYSSPS